jgi:hypothetical protein
MPENLTSGDFARHLHTAFKVETPEALEFELTEVDDRSNAAVEQFSVFFKGPQTPWLQQGTYELVHEEMQRLTLFLVPLGPKDGGMVYQAVFSRFIAANSPAPGA